jgi:hypothetical protein
MERIFPCLIIILTQNPNRASRDGRGKRHHDCLVQSANGRRADCGCHSVDLLPVAWALFHPRHPGWGVEGLIGLLFGAQCPRFSEVTWAAIIRGEMPGINSSNKKGWMSPALPLLRVTE